MSGFGCSIYGQSLYGTFIYAEYCKVLLYDFGIQTYDISSGDPIIGISWELYKRDTTLPYTSLVDDTHILVDSGTSVESLIKINLLDYSIRNDQNDFYIKAWKDEDIEHLSEINIDYYPTDYTVKDDNQPYLYHKLGLIREGGVGGGCITIEKNRWQLIAIPIKFGYWSQTQSKLVHDDVTIARVKNYVIDQIDDIESGNVEDLIEVCNAYIGDKNFFYNYVVGKTNEGSTHNFELSYQDEECLEVTGFWIKSIADHDITISWGEI